MNQSMVLEVRREVPLDVGRSRIGAMGWGSRGNVLLLVGCRVSRSYHWAPAICALLGMCVMFQPKGSFFCFFNFCYS